MSLSCAKDLNLAHCKYSVRGYCIIIDFCSANAKPYSVISCFVDLVDMILNFYTIILKFYTMYSSPLEATRHNCTDHS